MVCGGGETREPCEKCEGSEAGDSGGSAGEVGGGEGVANGDLTVRDTEVSEETQVVVTPSDGETVPSEAGGAVGGNGSGAGEASVVGGESETGDVGEEDPQEDPRPPSKCFCLTCTSLTAGVEMRVSQLVGKCIVFPGIQVTSVTPHQAHTLPH